MVGAKIIDRAMGMIIKGELAKATADLEAGPLLVQSCRVAPAAPQNVQGGRGPAGGEPLHMPQTPLHLRDSTWMSIQGHIHTHRGSPFLHSEL